MPAGTGSGAAGGAAGIAPGPLRRRAALASGLIIVLAGFGLFVFNVLAQGPKPERLRRHLLVISVDGLGANLLAASLPSLRIPNLRRLKEEGSSAEGVEGVYPSVTYPSHATLVTGRFPAEHGIYTNLSSREAGKNPRDWFWFAKSIQAPAVWEVARKAGLETGAVSWPVTAGAAIDWNVPEIWDPEKVEIGDPMYLAKFMNPLVTLELAAVLGSPRPGDDDDTNRTRAAVYLLAKHKPDLFLVHLANLDNAEHEHGPQSREAAAALEQIDARIGDILAAMKDAGLDGVTDVFIVSDHGFLPTTRVIQPNVLLARAGLLATNSQGVITGGRIATVANGGSFFIYWPEGRDLRQEVRAALKPLLDQEMLWAMFDRQALRELGAEPAAQMALEAPAGAYFDSRARAELVHETKSTGGNHGFLPTRPGLEASFIAWGPRVKRGVNLHRVRMTAIAPTLLTDLGLEARGFGDDPPINDIFK